MPNRMNLSLVAAFIFIAGTAAYAQPKVPNPELVGLLTKQLSIKPEQAVGGAGALFGLAKTQLPAAQFAKIAKAVPGMNGLIAAAPKPTKSKSSTTDMLGSVAGALPAQMGGMAGQASQLAGMAGAFKKLGLSPDMVAQFVPIMFSGSSRWSWSRLSPFRRLPRATRRSIRSSFSS